MHCFSGAQFFSLHNRNRTRSVSFLACADLKCIDRCAETSVNSMRETLSKEQKIARLHSFASRRIEMFRDFTSLINKRNNFLSTI